MKEYRFKQPYIQAQEANTLCYASFLRQTYYIYRPGILGLYRGRHLKNEIWNAIEELEADDFDLRTGIFTSEKSIQINATKDRDHNSHTPSKVMAFIPVKLVLLKEYKVKEGI
ncbi:MAG: hypothetical protein QM725_13015 [Lacibacter sp.]